MTQTSRIKEEVRTQAYQIKTKEVIKSELDHIKDIFVSYNQVKSIDARRMVIEEMLKLYKSGQINIVEDNDAFKRLAESQVQNDFSPSEKESWEMYQE